MANQTLIDTYTQDWVNNSAFIENERIFSRLMSIYPVEVKEEFKNALFEYQELKGLSVMVIGAILVDKGYFKELLVSQARLMEEKEKLEDWKTYEKEVKKGNRFARQVIKSDPVRFGDKAEYLLELCKLPEPMTYKFKQAEMVGNIF